MSGEVTAMNDVTKVDIHQPLFVFTLLHLICVISVLVLNLLVCLCCYCRRRRRRAREKKNTAVTPAESDEDLV